METQRARAWKYKDNINTDIISPPAYMELPIEQAAAYAMSPIDPCFARDCKPGDLLVAEENLGSGSSRETAPLTLKALGIRCIIAKSYARIFYRNCMNVGLLALVCAQADRISIGDVLGVELNESRIHNYTTNECYPFAAIPAHVLAIVEAGGLYPFLQQKLKGDAL